MTLTKCKGEKGFTMLEIIVVIAIIAVILVVASAVISKGRESGNMSAEGDRIRSIIAGLAEYKTYRGSLPVQAAMGTTWPTALNSYIIADYRSGGTYVHGYKCDTTSMSVTLQTPAMDDTTQADNIRQKMIDQGICDSTSPAITTANEIQCILSVFKSGANCT